MYMYALSNNTEYIYYLVGHNLIPCYCYSCGGRLRDRHTVQAHAKRPRPSEQDLADASSSSHTPIEDRAIISDDDSDECCDEFFPNEVDAPDDAIISPDDFDEAIISPDEAIISSDNSFDEAIISSDNFFDEAIISDDDFDCNK